MGRGSSFNKVALVSAPWPLYNRPSIQLGTLKAYLQTCYPDLQVQTYHLYLEIAAALGYRIYKEASLRMWLAESIYAALLNPDRAADVQRFYEARAVDKPSLQTIAFSDLLGSVRKATARFVARIGWQQYALVGFSICLSQLTASFYVIQRIKKEHPGVPVVIGGASLTEEGAQDLLDVFPQIDGAVVGEGEQPLALIVDHLRNDCRFEDLPHIHGLITRRLPSLKMTSQLSQMANLDDLPLPDFRDYFTQVQSLSPGKRFFPVLSAEMSRGCWWQKKAPGGSEQGCAFCNLNRQWQGYRAKQPDKIVSEIDHLTSMYQSLSVAFMDNVLPLRKTQKIFEGLAGLNKDLNLFAEVRARVPYETLRTMRDAGVRELQIGIEALSSRLLKKLNKGATCLDNLEIIKNCEELGIANVSNLITHFPGSDDKDVAETLDVLEFVQPFRPLKTVRFWLGRGSPVARNPQPYGLKAVYNHPHYTVLLSKQIAQKVRMMVQAYRGDLTAQHKRWQPVIKRVAAWQRAYTELKALSGSEPLLGYQDGRDFLILFRRQAAGEVETHRLTGPSRRIYLFCQKQRSIKSICRAFPTLGEDRIGAFLKTMQSKKLMYGQGDRCLSLAVSSSPARGRRDI